MATPKTHPSTSTKYRYHQKFPTKPRAEEVVGGGYFVFRRGDSTGRIRPSMWPYEHGTAAQAALEAERLAAEYGGHFDVLRVIYQATSISLVAEGRTDG